jgi:hypothetical protein
MIRKWHTLGIRITGSEKEFITQSAQDNGMTTSEYVRARLFIDADDTIKTATPVEKWMVKALSCLLVNSSEVTEKVLGRGEYVNNKITNRIEKLMKKSQFLDDDDINNEY